MLGEALDSRVQMYLKKVREGGGVVSCRIVIAAARGLVRSHNPLMLVENGGYVNLNRHWANSQE